MATNDVCPCCGQVIKPPPKARRWSASEDERLNAMVDQNLDHRSIAADLGRPVTSIRSRLLTLSNRPASSPSVDDDPVDDVEEDALEEALSEVVRPGVRIVTHRLRG